MLLSLFASQALAAEVQFDGFYRARVRGYDTLTLDSTSAAGAAALMQHRLWLQPKFLLTDQVAVFAQIRGFDNLVWGTEPVDPFAQSEVLLDYDLAPPTGETTDTLLDFSLWRAWAEVYTSAGQFSFGRVPLSWGNGMWLNDGVSVDPLYADHGDTTDRLMWEYLVQDQIYFRLSVDTVAERLVDASNDDTTGLGLAVAYRTEDLTAGVTAQFDHTGSEAEDILAGNLFTVDAAADVTLGKLAVAGEVVGRFGSGTLTGQDATVVQIGATLDATLDLDVYKIRARGGFASGDSDGNDPAIHTFTFDRDFSVGMFLFEQPVLTVGEDGSDPVAMGSAVSNALFLKPTFSRKIVDGLWIDASWLGARTARGEKLGGVSQSRSYGNEFQLGATYDAIQHLTVDGHLGAFLPGSAYSRSADALSDTGFDRPVFGFQLTGQVSF